MHLALFDFDWTLFRSPDPPPHWPGPWHSEAASLGPPCVPARPGPEWWNGAIVDAARAAIADPETYTIFLTGRERELFQDRVFDLLDQIDLRFNTAALTPASAWDVGAWKLDVLVDVARRLDPERIDIYDDYDHYLYLYVTALESEGYWAIPHLVRPNPQVAICEES